MYLDVDYFSQLKKRFEGQSKNMPEINRSQAMLLKKADVIPNVLGSAMGMHYFENNTHVFIMPGVPDEMKAMVQNYIIPNYMENEQKRDKITIKTAGIMESRLAEKTERLMKKHASSFRFAFLPHYTGVSFRIRQTGEADSLQIVKDEFFKVMQPYAYGFDDDILEGVLAKGLIDKHLTIATAESCTGGYLSKKLTNLAGSSVFFKGAVIAYSNKIKCNILDVPGELLNIKGAVSEEVALKMAEGVKNKFKTDVGISTTGISGPDGGSVEKPVGLIYIAIVIDKDKIIKKFNLIPNRSLHRTVATHTALNLLRLLIK